MNVPAHYSPVMPYFVVPSAADFIEFITNGFDAKEMITVPGDDGLVTDAEYRINGGTIMLGQSGGEWKPFPCAVLCGDR